MNRNRLAIIIALVLGAIASAFDFTQPPIVVLPDKPSPIEQYAARELMDFWRKATGQELTLGTDGTHAIRIGRAASFDNPFMPNEAAVDIGDNIINIAGGDNDTADPLHAARAHGTLFALYDFLESELGVRFLWPGELGTYVPQFKGTTIPNTSRRIPAPLPSAVWRQSKTNNRATIGWASVSTANQFHQKEALWLHRHRFNNIRSMQYGHAFTKWHEKYFKDHPEWFNMMPDGKRALDPTQRSINPSYISMCVTNEAFQQEIVDNWLKNGNMSALINCNENDTTGRCTCPRCLAADGTPVEPRLAAAREAYSQHQQNWVRHLGSLSDRYAEFYLGVQKKAEKVAENPVVIGDIYANYFEPPQKHKLNERILMRFCPPIMYPWTQQKITDFKRLWTGWHDAGASLMFRPNFTLDGHNFPLVYYRAFAECFRHAEANGLKGVDMDSLTGIYGVNALTCYVIANLAPGGCKRTIEELENDFFSAFGNAAPAIREYYRIMEEATVLGFDKDANLTPPNNEGGNWSMFFLGAERIFTNDVMKRGDDALRKAAELAKGDDTVSARVAFIQAGLEDCKLVIATQRGFAEFQKSRNYRPFSKAIKALHAFRRDNEHLGYANLGWMAFLENRSWPMLFAILDDDARELTGWKIIFDPQKLGDSKGYATEPDMTNAAAISLDSHWEQQPVGLEWREKHGKHFKGVAWYVTTFDAQSEETDAANKMKLCFGAIDGSSLIYLNGKLLADRPYPYKGNTDSWKIPFDLQLPAGLLKPKANKLVIRVEKYIGVSGIWRPVYLAQGIAAEELPDNDIIHVKWRENTNHGKFRYASKDYPLVVECLAKGEDGKAWGRLFQAVPVTPGHVYKVRIRYKTSNIKGRCEAWLRSGKERKLSDANKNVPLTTLTDKESTASVTIIPETTKLSIFLNILDNTGYLEVTALSITDEAKQP